ncbi:MAG TPA: roadblock/LC7 domain-containing protein [Cellulomonas sp.]
MTTSSTETDFGWLLDNFVRATPGTRMALVVSADGLLMALSAGVARTTGDQLAAIVAGISSLARGAARELGARTVLQSVIDLDDGFLMLMSISNGSLLAVSAEAGAEVGMVGYEMALLVRRAEAVLTPQLVVSLRDALPTDGPTGRRAARLDAPTSPVPVTVEEPA